MKFLLLTPFAVAAGFFGPPLLQDPMADTQVKATHVAGPVHMLVGRGGNIGVSVGDDGILMIDDQFTQLEEKIRAAIAELGEGAPRWLVNTHWHGDHTGGNAAFAKDALIFAHENVRARLKSGGGRGAPAPAEALPVVTYRDSISLHVNGEEVRVLHFPAAHTDGDSVLHFTGSNVIHAGDLFFHGRFPFVDLQSGGSVEGLVSAVKRLLKEAPEGVQIIPGHGELTDRAGLKAYAAMLEVSTTLVGERIAAGMSESETVAAGLPEEYASWAWSFISQEAWLQTVYRSLSKE